MTLQEKINSDLKTAMLEKNEPLKSLLRVLIGELNREGKVIPDERVIATVKKMIENAKIVGNDNEIALLENYLPQQLSEEKLSGLITALIFNNNYTVKDMGKIMAALKAQYAGQYDGKLASSLIKAQLS